MTSNNHTTAISTNASARSDDMAERVTTTFKEIVNRVSCAGDAWLIDGKETTDERFGEPRARTAKTSADPTISDLPAKARGLAAGLYKFVYKAHPLGLTTPPHDDRIRDEAFVAELKKAVDSRWARIPNFEIVELGSEVVRLRAEMWDEFAVPRSIFEGPDTNGRGTVIQHPYLDKYQPSYLHIFGEDSVPAGWRRIARFYWNVAAEGAIPLTRVLTARLNRYRIPFQFKTLQHPKRYWVVDPAVLYVPWQNLPRASPVIAEIHREIRRYLRKSTPPFTRSLGHGVGFAENPSAVMSFGEHRCLLLARFLLAARDEGATAPAQVLASLVERLEKAGYPPGRFHLNPDTTDDVHIALQGPPLPYGEDHA